MKNTLTLKDKREICVLKQSKPAPTNRELAIRFKVRENTVCDILKWKSEYLGINPEDPNSHNKRLRKGKYPGLEDALILWTTQMLKANLTVTGSVLQSKATCFAELLGFQEFKASGGWLSNFKKRHNFSQYSKAGEANSAPLELLPSEHDQLHKFWCITF